MQASSRFSGRKRLMPGRQGPTAAWLRSFILTSFPTATSMEDLLEQMYDFYLDLLAEADDIHREANQILETNYLYGTGSMNIASLTPGSSRRYAALRQEAADVLALADQVKQDRIRIYEWSRSVVDPNPSSSKRARRSPESPPSRGLPTPNAKRLKLD